MKRSVRAAHATVAVLLVDGGTGVACRKASDPGLIVASGHVEAVGSGHDEKTEYPDDHAR